MQGTLSSFKNTDIKDRKGLGIFQMTVKQQQTNILKSQQEKTGYTDFLYIAIFVIFWIKLKLVPK